MQVAYEAWPSGSGDSYDVNLNAGGRVWSSGTTGNALVYGTAASATTQNLFGGQTTDKHDIRTLKNFSGEGVQFTYSNKTAACAAMGVYRQDFDFNLLQPR